MADEDSHDRDHWPLSCPLSRVCTLSTHIFPLPVRSNPSRVWVVLISVVLMPHWATDDDGDDEPTVTVDVK